MANKRKRASKPSTKAKKVKATDGGKQPFKLLQLPQELRDLVWISLFSSTRLTWGTHQYRSKLRPAPNSLALLRTCKQIYEETKTLWLKFVLFNFKDGESLLDKLTPLPLATLSQIRHVRLCDCIMVMNVPHSDRDTHYRPVALFMLLPGLQLDTLTILAADSYPEVYYHAVQGLVEKGNGWKELHFITPNSAMLGFAQDFQFGDLRKPQPAQWNTELVRRDTGNTGASVTIYRSTASDIDGSVLNPATREIINQQLTSPENSETFGVAEDTDFSTGSKELLVVVRRGRDASISEPLGIQYGDPREDIRDWAGLLPWSKIKEMSYADCIDDEEEDDKNVEIDFYKDVTEYDWETTCMW